MIEKSDVIRWILTLLLIIAVWMGIKWAIALFITLASIRFELEDYLNKK